jgi:hypothetical protein
VRVIEHKPHSCSSARNSLCFHEAGVTSVNRMEHGLVIQSKAAPFFQVLPHLSADRLHHKVSYF